MSPTTARARICVAAAAFVLAACGSDALTTPTTSAASAAACTPTATGADSFTQPVALTTLPDGLQYGDYVVGTGAAITKGENVTVQYTGWLTNGCVFDSSREAGRSPFQFVIGANPPNVIAGWDEGVLSMHVGGKRRLVIPPALGYGSSGQGPIPPGATLVFDVEVLGATAPSPTP